MNPESSIQSPESSSPETLVRTSRAQLMRYAREPSPSIAGNIANCVDKLLTHPQFDEPPQERRTYRHMRTYWRLVESLG
jgi:hypothetical protein